MRELQPLLPIDITDPGHGGGGAGGGYGGASGANPAQPAPLPTVKAPDPFVFDKPEAKTPEPDTLLVIAQDKRLKQRIARQRFQQTPRSNGINL